MHVDPPLPRDDKRVLRGDTRRTAILTAATRLFGLRGYEGTRIADVAAEAGVTDAGVLHHFSSKHELFFAVVERRESAYQTVFERARAAEITDVRSLFDAFVASVSTAVENPDLVRFRRMLTGAAGMQGHPIEGRYRRNLEAMLEVFPAIVAHAQEAGEIRSDVDGVQIVLEILALNEGIRDQWLTLPERIDYVGTFSTAVEGLYARIAEPGYVAGSAGE